MAAAAFAYRTKENSSSDSDTDDSDNECRDWKRATRRTNEENLEKIPIEPSLVNPLETPSVNPTPEGKSIPSKRKRNKIWCNVLDDQMMSETLGHCGIKNKPKGYGSRGEESYDYTLGYKYAKRDDDDLDKMSEDEMSDTSETSSVVSHRSRNFHQSKYVKLDSAGAKAAQKIIKTLGEQKQYLIYRVVKHIGIEKAIKLMKMTEEIEENGGMMIKNNARRRTPGGVYFQLLKSEKDIEKTAIDQIFDGEMNSFEMKRAFDDRRKRKKRRIAAEKATLLKQFSEEIEFLQPEKQQETPKLEEESMVTEEESHSSKDILPNPKIADSKGSDLEDGEIDE